MKKILSSRDYEEYIIKLGIMKKILLSRDL